VEDAVTSNGVLFDAYGTHGVLDPLISVVTIMKSFDVYYKMGETVKNTGGFNQIVIANSTIAPPEWMTTGAYSVCDDTNLTPNGCVFRKTTNQYDPDLYPTRTELIEEIYLTLYASHMGVGPSVYAAAILRGGLHEFLYMVLSGGSETGSRFDEKNTPKLLYESCERASNAGLLLLDIKIPNTITVLSPPEETLTIQMIDFGADFTLQIFDANYSDGDGKASCLLFLNLFLLLSNIKCHTVFPTATITELFLMMKKLDTKVLLCDVVDSISIPTRWVMSSDYFIDEEEGEEIEIELQKPSKKHIFGVTGEEEYKKLVINYIYMLRWYIFEENCERRPQWTPSKDKTFIEQLEKWLLGPPVPKP